ncbi:ChaN family lipoprotein [Bdellovibrionota bacterium FG-1]
MTIRLLGVCVMVMLSFSHRGFAFEGAGQWAGKVIEVRTGHEMTISDLPLVARSAQTWILAEKHYNFGVQQAQAEVIRAVVGAKAAQKNFTTAWEFLSFSERESVDDSFQRYQAGQFTVGELLKRLQHGLGSETYAPIMEVTRELGGALAAVNLTREEKAPVVTGGIEALDPRLLPPDFVMGSVGYHDRFKEVMEQGGHATPAQIENYFAAQCLTDDVIAYHLVNDVKTALKFLVVGSFHAEYSDGVVARLRDRQKGEVAITVRLIDTSDYLESELPGLLRDSRYGDLAEYVIFVNEPSVEKPLSNR